jgi:hypothetical protein
MRHVSREAVLGSLAACAALVAPCSGAETTTTASCPTPSGRTVVRTLPLPGPPHQVLARGDTLWVTLRRPGGRARVIRLDARAGRIDRSFPLEGLPDRLVYGFGSLWIPQEIRGKPGGTLIRLDPRSGRVLAEIRAPAPRLFGATLTVTPAAVWIGGADTRLDTSSIFLVDPRRNAVVRRFGVIGTTVVALVARGPAVWASGWESIVKLSPAGRLLFRQRIGGVAFSIALAPDGVWGAQQFFGRKYRKPQPLAHRLVRVATSPRHFTVVPLDATPGSVDFAAGSAWVVFFPDQRRHAILRVSGTPPVPETVPVHGLPVAIAPASDGVWIAEHDPNELSKVC